MLQAIAFMLLYTSNGVNKIDLYILAMSDQALNISLDTDKIIDSIDRFYDHRYQGLNSKSN